MKLVICLLAAFVGCCYGSGFHKSKRAMTWDQGEAYCQAHKMELAFPTSEKDYNDHFKHLKGHYWVGIIRCWPNNPHWCTELFTKSYRSWMNNEPNNFGGNENCAHFVNGKMNDNRCDRKYRVICRKQE